MRAPLLTLALVLVPAAAPSAAVVAQSTSGRVAGGVAIESYSFSDPSQAGLERITLITAPFAARAVLGRNASLEVLGTFAKGTLTRADGSESELSGLTDTNVFVNATFASNAVTLTGIVSVPSGNSTHTAAEAAVAGAVAADLLPFRVTHWGAGGGVGLQVTGARRFEAFGAGLSVSYRVAGEFEPVDGNTASYQPGDELRVRLALDTEMGRNGKGSLTVGFQRYSGDAFDGVNLFQSGNRVEVTGSYAFPLGYKGAAAFYGGVLHRANGSFLDAVTPDAPSQDLVLLGGQLRKGFRGGWLNPRFDVRFFRSEDGVGQGYVAGVGGSLELSSEAVTFIPTAMARFGNVDVRQGQASSFTGFEAGASIRFGR